MDPVHPRCRILGLVVPLALVACSSSSDGTEGLTGGVAGAGSSFAGAAPQSGGQSSVSGGSTAWTSGGAAPNPGTGGSTTAAGGAGTPSGGSGGVVATGGSGAEAPLGGSTALGVGGASSGGAPPLGGTSSLGGAPDGEGGAAPSGGAPGAGGSDPGSGGGWPWSNGGSSAGGGGLAGAPPTAGGGNPSAGAAGELDPGAAGQGGEAQDCPGDGHVVYSLNGSASWPADAVERITAAMDEAVWYYNCYSNLSHTLTVNYSATVQTAEANVDGWMTFGSSPSYQVLATALHEIGHTMGVGYYPWTELTDGDRHWTGAAVLELMASLPDDEKDPGASDFITADSMHFWPYGLNYASEYVSEWSLINHVRIVAAMNVDKQAYLASY